MVSRPPAASQWTRNSRPSMSSCSPRSAMTRTCSRRFAAFPSVTRSVIAAFTSRQPRLTAGAVDSGMPQHGAASPRRTAQPSFTALTDREREVVSLVAAGLSNDEIADKLVVSPLTAKTHVSRAMTKLGARDRAQLVVMAYQNGLANPAGG